MTVMITAYQLSTAVGCSMARAAEWCGVLGEACTEFEINTANRICAFIAQVAHESARFEFVKELANGKAYDTGRLATALGNTPDADGDGQRYKGRGLIEITGQRNYLLCGFALGYDLLAQPELLETPRLAARSAGWFWKNEGLNEIADLPSQSNFERITRRINGGYNGIEDRLKLWASCRKVW